MWSKLIVIPALILCLSPLTAGSQIAADVRDNESRHAWLGLVNPGGEPIALTLTGYGADGTDLGTLAMSLPAYGRAEHKAADLFDGVAWISVDTNDLPVGYVRYADAGGTWMSIAPLSRTSGAEVWVAQVNAGTEALRPQTVLVNTSAATGSALSQPTTLSEASGKRFGEWAGSDGSVFVPDFGAPHQQTLFDYASAFAKPEQLTWDTVRADQIEITAVQHLSDSGGQTRAASFNPPRTPDRRMIGAALQPLRPGGWNKLILINTNEGPLRVDITPHYSYYGTPPHDYTYQTQAVTFVLEAGERREVDLDEPTQQNLPAAADWFEIVPHDGGLLGYQLFGTTDGNALGALEAGHVPGSNRVLPHVVTDAETYTQIGLINTAEEEGRGRIMGYDNDGNLVAQKMTARLRGYEKLSFTTEELFGDKAEQISWVMVRNTNGHLAATAVVARRDHSAMAGFSGTPTVATTAENLFETKLESFNIEALQAHGWQEQHFTKAGNLIFGHPFENANGSLAKPGEFMIEDAFNADEGYFYLGYEPYHSNNWAAESFGIWERVALISPAIEVPHHGQWYINYRMRFHNPNDATWNSRYGVLWRYEGGDQWHWFGLTGQHLLNPDVTVSDCWVDIQWRNLDITVTQWLEFGNALPPETAGRRIQLAYYYDQRPDSAGDTSPWMFLDSLVIRPTPSATSLFYPVLGEGTLTTEELRQFEDTNPLPPPATKDR